MENSCRRAGLISVELSNVKKRRLIEFVLILSLVTLSIGIWQASKSRKIDISQLDKNRALSLVREAGRILYPPNDDGGPPAFDPMSALGYGKRNSLAEAKYSEALEVWPNCIDALVMRSANRFQMGDSAGAREDATRALQLDPDPRYYILLATVFERADQRRVLRRGMNQAGKEHPLYGILWYSLAQTYFYDGDFESQVSELEALCAFDPSTMNYESLGGAYRALGQLQKAASAYEKGLPESAESLVRLRMEQGDASASLAILAEYQHSLEQTDVLIYGALIKALDGQSVPEAKEAYEAVVKQGDENLFGVDHFSSGVLLLVLGRKDLGQMHLRRFREWIASNPTEWGVTLRWRGNKAKELLHLGLPAQEQSTK